MAYTSSSIGILEDYVLFDVFSIIASVGGSLGLFLGFSCFDCFNRLWNFAKEYTTLVIHRSPILRKCRGQAWRWQTGLPPWPSGGKQPNRETWKNPGHHCQSRTLRPRARVNSTAHNCHNISLIRFREGNSKNSLSDSIWLNVLLLVFQFRRFFLLTTLSAAHGSSSYLHNFPRNRPNFWTKSRNSGETCLETFLPSGNAGPFHKQMKKAANSKL